MHRVDVAQAGAMDVTLTYDSANGAQSTQQDTVLTYQTNDVTATAGVDYEGAPNGTLTIPAAQPTAGVWGPPRVSIRPS